MDNLIGKKLDGLYEVRELIGSGGMANVYKAVMLGHNGPVPAGTVVAVKVLRQEYMHDPDLVRRFKNESKAISLLNHPNIVKVYDVSVNDDLQYIVMEYVDGMTLREYLNQRGGKLTNRETVHFISQILKALEHAHANGVVHRDIKPQNIMLLAAARPVRPAPHRHCPQTAVQSSASVPDRTLQGTHRTGCGWYSSR